MTAPAVVPSTAARSRPARDSTHNQRVNRLKIMIGTPPPRPRPRTRALTRGKKELDVTRRANHSSLTWEFPNVELLNTKQSTRYLLVFLISAHIFLAISSIIQGRQKHTNNKHNTTRLACLAAPQQSQDKARQGDETREKDETSNVNASDQSPHSQK